MKPCTVDVCDILGITKMTKIPDSFTEKNRPANRPLVNIKGYMCHSASSQL